MQPIKITKVEDIKNVEVLDEVKNLQSNQIILIFGDGTFTKIDDNYEGQLKDIYSGEALTLNPINMNWRPLWVGIRLFNADIRAIRQEQFKNVSYITHYIENDINKK